MNKQDLIAALRAFIEQRGGIEPGNYGDAKSYNQERRQVYTDLEDARLLLRAIEWRASITAEMIHDAAKGGRITFAADGSVDYCTGQYFPTEYRKAVCRLCANVLWVWTRVGAMPAEMTMPAAVWMRRHFRKEFGARLARKYFD